MNCRRLIRPPLVGAEEMPEDYQFSALIASLLHRNRSIGGALAAPRRSEFPCAVIDA
jgi:hypothetical protein